MIAVYWTHTSTIAKTLAPGSDWRNPKRVPLKKAKGKFFDDRQKAADFYCKMTKLALEGGVYQQGVVSNVSMG